MTKIYKGLNSVQNENVGEVTVLGLCTSCDDALSLHHENIPKGFSVIERTRNHDVWTDGHTDGRTDGRTRCFL